MIKFFIILILSFSILPIRIISADISFEKLFYNQLKTFPQEKIYTQTDKANYWIKDTIWFRSFLVDNTSLIQDSTSRYIYAELIDPYDSIVSRVKIRPENLVYSGYIVIHDDIPAGDYQLRFYTRYMENLGENYFYRKKISIKNNLLENYKIDVIGLNNSKKQLNYIFCIKNPILHLCRKMYD